MAAVSESSSLASAELENISICEAVDRSTTGSGSVSDRTALSGPTNAYGASLEESSEGGVLDTDSRARVSGHSLK